MDLREPLTSENLLTTYNPALECILDKLDFCSLLNFTWAVYSFDELLKEIDLRYETKEAERWLATPSSDDWVQSKVNLEMSGLIKLHKNKLKSIILADIRSQKRHRGIISIKTRLTPPDTTEEYDV